MRGILIAIVLGLTALTFYSALWFKSETIERDITDRVTKNLGESGAKDIAIDVDGRHVTLSGVVYDEAVETAHLDTADQTYGALGPIDGLTYLQDGGFISASKTDTGITLRGTVPDEDTRAALLAAASEATDGDVDDQLTISGPSAAWQDEASFGMTQLAGLTTGTMTAAAGAYALSGVTDGDAAAVEGAVADREGWQAFVSAPDVTNDLSQEVARLNGDITGLQSDVSTRDATIAALQADVTGLNSSVADLSQERDTLGTELENLRASMTEGETDVAALREQLATAETDINTASAVIADRDATIVALNGEVAALRTETDGLNGRIAVLETDLANRQVDLGSTDEQVSALNLSVAGLNTDLAARDAEIADLTGVVAERDATIASLEGDVTERDAQIADLTGTVAARDEAIAALSGTVEEKTAEVAALQEEVTERAVEISDLTRVVVSRNETIASNDANVAAAQAQIAALTGEVTERDAAIDESQARIAELQTVVQQRDATIAALQNRPVATSNAAQCAAQASAVMEGSEINFATATATIENNSVELLERLTGIALACVGDDLTVEIGGHTDAQGSDENNQALSEARAQAVVAFMAERGVPTDGLRAVGYGESQPIASNDTAEGRAQNRRISFDWQAR